MRYWCTTKSRCSWYVVPLLYFLCCTALVLDAPSAGPRSLTLRGAQHCLMTMSVNSRPPLRMSPRYWTRDPTTTSLAQVTEQFNRTESNPILHSKLRLAGPAASITAIRIRKPPPSRRYATKPDARRAYFPIQRPRGRTIFLSPAMCRGFTYEVLLFWTMFAHSIIAPGFLVLRFASRERRWYVLPQRISANLDCNWTASQNDVVFWVLFACRQSPVRIRVPHRSGYCAHLAILATRGSH